MKSSVKTSRPWRCRLGRHLWEELTVWYRSTTGLGTTPLTLRWCARCEPWRGELARSEEAKVQEFYEHELQYGPIFLAPQGQSVLDPEVEGVCPQGHLHWRSVR